MEWFIFWILFAGVVGIVASSRGRSGFGWFLLSILISPLLGVILVALMPALPRPAAGALSTDLVACEHCGGGVPRGAGLCRHCKRPLVCNASKPALVQMGERVEVKCPECAELVLAEAKRCKHCGAQITPSQHTPAPA